MQRSQTNLMTLVLLASLFSCGTDDYDPFGISNAGDGSELTPQGEPLLSPLIVTPAAVDAVFALGDTANTFRLSMQNLSLAPITVVSISVNDPAWMEISSSATLPIELVYEDSLEVAIKLGNVDLPLGTKSGFVTVSWSKASGGSTEVDSISIDLEVLNVSFSYITTNIFEVYCTKCHSGNGAPQGMKLDAANAYANIVSVASGEKPTLLRVNPFDPETSYLVHKIEGRSGITGGRMPLNDPPLKQADISSIRKWIERGALND